MIKEFAIEIDIAGWTVSDEAGHTYTFPNAGVTLQTGSGEDAQIDRY